MDDLNKAVIKGFDNMITKAFLRLPGVAQLGGASIDAFISGLLEIRRGVFFKEIKRRQLLITKEIIKQEKFIDFFLITLDAVDRTRMQEKIEMFAAILCDYVETEFPEDGVHESLRDIIASLNVNDVIILQQIIAFEQGVKQRNVEMGKEGKLYSGEIRNDWEDFSQTLLEEFGMSDKAISLSVYKLIQNGIIRDSLSYNSSSIKVWEPGRTLATPLYYELLAILK